MRTCLFPLLFIPCILLTACTVGPDFKRPDAPKIAAYTAHSMPDASASAPVAMGTTQHFSSTLSDTESWWTSFGSNQLNTLVEQALQASPTITAARATLEQAQQTYEAQAGSTLLPKADLNLGAQRQVFNDALFGQSGTSKPFNLYNSNVAVSYLFDMFGGNRRALEAFVAQSDYQHDQLRAAQLTLAGNIATTAMTQAALYAQIEASQQILALQQQEYHIAKQRQVLGALTLVDVLPIKTQLEQTRASVLPLNLRLQQTSHLLAELAGKTPANFTTPHFTMAEFVLPDQLPWVVPSQLVRRRPDIQAAEALLHAANAQYGVAIANTYPQINLTANLGQEALSTGSLFNANSAIWSLAGQLTQPLFNGGLKAGVRAAKANLAIVDADYQQTVLQAFRNVADALRAVDNDAQTLTAQAAAEDASHNSLDLTTEQFKLGSVNVLQLLTVQQQEAQTRINLIGAQMQRLTDTAALYQAMGGAWVAPATTTQTSSSH